MPRGRRQTIDGPLLDSPDSHAALVPARSRWRIISRHGTHFPLSRRQDLKYHQPPDTAPELVAAARPWRQRADGEEWECGRQGVGDGVTFSTSTSARWNVPRPPAWNRRVVAIEVTVRLSIAYKVQGRV